MIRVLSRYNPRRFRQVLRWHLRDALLAYEDRIREMTRQDYYVSLLTYAVMAPYAQKKMKAPRRPRILSADD